VRDFHVAVIFEVKEFPPRRLQNKELRSALPPRGSNVIMEGYSVIIARVRRSPSRAIPQWRGSSQSKMVGKHMHMS